MPTDTASELGWVFLDRDGTINVAPPVGEYVTDPRALELLPGAGQAIARFNRAGVNVAVITNQRGVALGRMSLVDLEAVHARLRELLDCDGAQVDAIYACPHEIGECECRKPKPGMLLQAKRQFPDIDFARAAVVGDSLSDVEAARAVGARAILLCERAPRGLRQAESRRESLAEAATCLLNTGLDGGSV